GGGGGDDGCGGRARALGNRDVDGCSGGTITTDEVGGLAEEGGEGLFLGVLAVPDGPFGTGGVGRGGRVGELDLVGVGIPAPDFEHVGVGGEEFGGGGVGGVAVEPDGVPAALERVGLGLPLGVERGGRGGEKQGGAGRGGEEFSHRTLRR